MVGKMIKRGVQKFAQFIMVVAANLHRKIEKSRTMTVVINPAQHASSTAKPPIQITVDRDGNILPEETLPVVCQSQECSSNMAPMLSTRHFRDLARQAAHQDTVQLLKGFGLSDRDLHDALADINKAMNDQ
jgi:hypothetical protein